MSSEPKDFWSRRKAAVKAEAERETKQATQNKLDAEKAELEKKTDAEILEELKLQDPDQLDAGDDFKPYLAKTIPDRIKKRALRKLWRLNPTLANLDGLVDYGEDFTDSATVIEALTTTYQVGKGMLDHVLKMEAEERASEEKETGDKNASLTPKSPESLDKEPETIDQPDEDDANSPLTDHSLVAEIVSEETNKQINIQPMDGNSSVIHSHIDEIPINNPRKRRMRFS